MIYIRKLRNKMIKKIRNLLLVASGFCLAWFIVYAFTHVGYTTDEVIQDTAITDIVGLVCFATAALITAKMTS